MEYDDDDDDGDLAVEDIEAFIVEQTQRYNDDDESDEDENYENSDDDKNERDLCRTQDSCVEDEAVAEPTPKRPKNELFRNSDDNDDVVHLEIDNKWRIFKKGESFRHTKKDDRTIYTMIGAITTKQLTKEAICKVYMPLSDTFVGPTEAKRIGIKYVCFRFTQRIRFKNLSEVRCDEPVTSLYFEKPDGDAKSTGWNFAYHSNAATKLYVWDCPVALDLFAGAGGFSLGLQEAGFHVKYAVELDSTAAAAFKANHPKVERVYAEDVDIFIERVQSDDAGYPKVGSVDHIHASPPCQGYSRVSHFKTLPLLTANFFSLNGVLFLRCRRIGMVEKMIQKTTSFASLLLKLL